ncbi:hypothetical protein LAZ67_12000374 [Cordylochernes scorpioides]|uniref:Uncharacterized protein n=1 Tax=Cordylochernes scorpioides TaxID=51811 RepID=A0ABY6L0H6_9ARAC|nr:hypothetical protein LAZ67_12000374 [Cordylochernes scorpioides]
MILWKIRIWIWKYGWKKWRAKRGKKTAAPNMEYKRCSSCIPEALTGTGQGRCAELMKLWGYTKDPNCACNIPQSMSHILDDCPLYKFNGGISNLHSVTPEALNWLKALPLRL